MFANLFTKMFSQPDEVGEGPLTLADRIKWAKRPRSFTDILPWTQFEPEDEVFPLNDGISVAAMFEVTPTATEAMAEDMLEKRANLAIAAMNSVPEEEDAEWIVQFFVNDDSNMDSVIEHYENYIRKAHGGDPKRGEEVLNSQYTQAWLTHLRAHMLKVSNPDGLFVDEEVAKKDVFRCLLRRVFCIVYRQFPLNYRLPENAPDPTESLNSVALGLATAFNEADVTLRRCNGHDFYRWMSPFFNRPSGVRASELASMAPYPGDSDRGLNGTEDSAPLMGFDLAEHLTRTSPVSDKKLGAFKFDDVWVKALTLQNLQKQPEIGHLTAERKQADKLSARFDRLPAGTMLSMTIVIRPQHLVKDHVESILSSSRAKTAEAELTHGACSRVLQRMAQRDKLVPMFMTLYVSAPTPAQLHDKITAVNAQLTPSGLLFISPKNDLTPLDAFVRGLPMCFDPFFDTKYMHRARLVFMSQIGSLIPVYGRSRGSGNPGFPLWNRGGEPLSVDPLNNVERKKNGHLITLGPTGSGKSATLNYLLLNMMAIYRPRLVIVDAGKSFELLVQYFNSLGLTTHVVTLTDQRDDSLPSLPPFILAQALLDDATVMASYYAAERAGGANTGDVGAELTMGDAEQMELSASDAPAGEDEADPDVTEGRDILGEMIIAAIMMITGGEQKEIAAMSRSDRYLITRALIRAAQHSRRSGKPHPLSEDVAVELMTMSKDPSLSAKRQERAEDMGQAMQGFSQGLRGKLFNRYGKAWPDVDVTLVEMGTLANSNYEDALALAYTSLIDHVQHLSEVNQYDGRHTIFLTDEGHIITTNPLLGAKIKKGTKMWRKLMTWFWLATQSVGDFPDEMSQVLSMCEWFLILTIDKEEGEKLSRFRTFTEEQRLMLESARKEPPKYTEGVILSSGKQSLFRNIPPSIAMALAGTEGQEKQARRRIMDELSCSELDAALVVAEQLHARSLMPKAKVKLQKSEREAAHA